MITKNNGEEPLPIPKKTINIKFSDNEIILTR